MRITFLKLALLIAAAATPGAAQSTFPALLADKPYPKYSEKLGLFGQFVGVWTFEGREYHDDGTRATDKGEIHMQWILEGRAIQDVWLETERSDAEEKDRGTTVRIYDPKTDSWRITWMDPVIGAVRQLTGGKVKDEIVLEGKSEKGVRFRWIFSDITPGSFHWHAEKLAGGKWQVYEELDARRKS